MILPRWRLKGLDRFRRGLRRRREEILQAAGAACYEEASETISDAQVITPVDRGNLRASAFVLPPEYRGATVTVRFGFGGPAAPYAVHVHEDVRVFGLRPGGGARNFGRGRFRRYRGGRRRRKFVGQAKYLSTAIRNRAQGRAGRVARGITRGLRRR